MRRQIQHPTRLVPLTFLAVIVLGTGLLMLPVSRSAAGGAPFLTALFTSTSAVCVTGLSVQDTPVYWSWFGQSVILALIQIGGFGIMTAATLLTLLVTQRLRLGARLIAQVATGSSALGDIARILRLIFLVTIGVELATAAILSLRLRYAYGEPWNDAIWNGIFHAVSAFNNAGFSTYSDSLTRFATDPFFILPIIGAVVVGGLGIPVLHDLRGNPFHATRWSIHTKVTLLGTAFLLLSGMAAVFGFEANNPATIGPFDLNGKLLAALFHSAMTRAAGFNSVPIGEMRPETLTFSYGLMLVGGGSAGTAGGIKVTTFFLLGFVVWAEIRGNPETNLFNRCISTELQRQALSIVLLAVGTVAVATLALLCVTHVSFDKLLFEAISAFCTVGLTTGITPDLPVAAQAILISLMFFGRVGTVSVATALALRRKQRHYRYPEERLVVG